MLGKRGQDIISVIGFTLFDIVLAVFLLLGIIGYQTTVYSDTYNIQLFTSQDLGLMMDTLSITQGDVYFPYTVEHLDQLQVTIHDWRVDVNNIPDTTFERPKVTASLYGRNTHQFVEMPKYSGNSLPLTKQGTLLTLPTPPPSPDQSLQLPGVRCTPAQDPPFYSIVVDDSLLPAFEGIDLGQKSSRVLHILPLNPDQEPATYHGLTLYFPEQGKQEACALLQALPKEVFGGAVLLPDTLLPEALPTDPLTLQLSAPQDYWTPQRVGTLVPLLQHPEPSDSDTSDRGNSP